eukprot:1915_1
MLSPPAELLPASSDPRPQSEFESDVTPVVSRSVSPSPAHPGDPTNKSKKKTVLVFLGSKSKRTRALLSQIAQKRKDKKRARRDSKTTSVTRAQSLPVTPVSSSDNNNMQHHMNEAHMNELRQRLESNNQNRRGTYDRQLPQKPAKPVSKQRSYEPNPYNAYLATITMTIHTKSAQNTSNVRRQRYHQRSTHMTLHHIDTANHGRMCFHRTRTINSKDHAPNDLNHARTVFVGERHKYCN